jgi:hypothetical protein
MILPLAPTPDFDRNFQGLLDPPQPALVERVDLLAQRPVVKWWMDITDDSTQTSLLLAKASSPILCGTRSFVCLFLLRGFMFPSIFLPLHFSYPHVFEGRGQLVLRRQLTCYFSYFILSTLLPPFHNLIYLPFPIKVSVHSFQHCYRHTLRMLT